MIIILIVGIVHHLDGDFVEHLVLLSTEIVDGLDYEYGCEIED